MKNRKRRQTGDKRRAYTAFVEDLMDAFASLPFRQRRQAKMIADRRGVSLEEMLVEVAKVGLQKVLPQLEEISKTAHRRPMDAMTWRLIDQRLARLDWTRVRLDTLLHSSKSPVRNGTVRTCADGNRVLLALKSLLRRKGSSGSDAAALKRAG